MTCTTDDAPFLKKIVASARFVRVHHAFHSVVRAELGTRGSTPCQPKGICLLDL
jgi:hypothetical protein